MSLSKDLEPDVGQRLGSSVKSSGNSHEFGAKQH